MGLHNRPHLILSWAPKQPTSSSAHATPLPIPVSPATRDAEPQLAAPQQARLISIQNDAELEPPMQEYPNGEVRDLPDFCAVLARV
jgi:hypothetical protein